MILVNGMVTLPRMKAREILAVTRVLVALGAADAQLPAHVRAALDDVAALLPTLAAALGTTETEPALSFKVADRAVANAVRALVDYLAAWKRLPAGEFASQVDVATRCHAAITEGAGLGFLTYKPVVKHSEVQRKLDALRTRGLDAELRTLGGGAFLDHLVAVHAVYGVVAGVTEPKAPREPPVVGSTAAELAEAVRTYVVRALGMVDRKRPASRARVDALLEPIVNWKPTKSESTSDEDASEDAAPKTEPAKDEAPAVKPEAPANDNAPGVTPQRKVG